MKKLYTFTDSYLECDNCKIKIHNFHNEPKGLLMEAFAWKDAPCPSCGEKLLTKTEAEGVMNFLRWASFANLWFSWLTLFGFGEETKFTGHRKLRSMSTLGILAVVVILIYIAQGIYFSI